MTSSDDGKVKVVDFPASPEERARRLKAEVERLARLPVVEWMFYLETGVAEKHGIAPAKMKAMVGATIKAAEKKAREDKAEGQRAEKQQASAQRKKERQEREQQRAQQQADREAERKQREREKEFAAIIKLPSAAHEPRLAALAERLGDDLGYIREEFSKLVAVEEASSEIGEIEPWPEPVDLNVLLTETAAQIRRYVVIHDTHAAIAVVLWIAFAWVHEIATHSPILVFTSADADSGKTTICGVLRFLTPWAYAAAELTGPNLFRFVDRHHPTLIIDDADRLFERKPDLVHIVNVGWTRGTKIPRQEHGDTRWFDPSCAKVVAGAGMILPRTTATRTIAIKMLPKLPSEKVNDFACVDDDTFVTLRRKFARFAADHAAALKDADPAMTGLNNRARMNWKLLLTVADLAGGDWPKAARQAAAKLTRERREPSVGKRLLAGLYDLFARHGATLTSANVQRWLTADKDGEWAEYTGPGRPITMRQIANLLDAYDIHPDIIHPHGRSERGYRAEQFTQAFAHYLGKSSPLKCATVRTVRKTRKTRKKRGRKRGRKVRTVARLKG